MTITILIKIILVLSVFVGLISAIQAIMETRTPQGAIAWASVLVLFPFISVPLFWIFGRRKFIGKIKVYDVFSPYEPTKFNKYVSKAFKESETKVSPYYDNEKGWKEGAFSFYVDGNDVRLLKNGSEKFAALKDDLKKAKKYILIEYYIYRNDDIGLEIADILLERAKAGVKCRIIFDQQGTSKIKELKTHLKHTNIEILPFVTNRGFGNYLQINFRNHRKIVVIDGIISYTGGINVGNEYIDGGKKFSAWRDTSIRIKGPATTLLQYVFFRDWQFSANDPAKEEQNLLDWKPEKQNKNIDVLVLPTSPTGSFEYGTLFFMDLINRAQKRIWIANAYFAPDEQFISSLQNASLRGVQVTIMVPKNNDSKMLSKIFYSLSEQLEPFSNIHIYEYGEGFMHQKVFLIDDDFVVIGTHNFDNRALRLNFEVSALMKNKEFAKEVENMLLQDLDKCTPLPKDYFKKLDFWHRFTAKIAHLLAPIA